MGDKSIILKKSIINVNFSFNKDNKKIELTAEIETLTPLKCRKCKFDDFYIYLYCLDENDDTPKIILIPNNLTIETSTSDGSNYCIPYIQPNSKFTGDSLLNWRIPLYKEFLRKTNENDIKNNIVRHSIEKLKNEILTDDLEIYVFDYSRTLFELFELIKLKHNYNIGYKFSPMFVKAKNIEKINRNTWLINTTDHGSFVITTKYTAFTNDIIDYDKKSYEINNITITNIENIRIDKETDVLLVDYSFTFVNKNINNNTTIIVDFILKGVPFIVYYLYRRTELFGSVKL